MHATTRAKLLTPGSGQRLRQMFHESRLALCPASAVMEFAESFFNASDKARPINAWSSQPIDSAPSCEVMLDPSDHKRWRTALKLTWYRHTSFLLPNFNGSLTARPAAADSKLTIQGSYDWLPVVENASLDIIALAIARAATRSLLQQIALHCEAEWIVFKNGCPSIAMCNERSAVSAGNYAWIAP